MTGTDRSNGCAAADETVRRLLSGVFDCSIELAGHILLRGRQREFHERATIVRQGEPVSTLYIVIAVRVRTIVYSLEGLAVLLNEYRAGDCFGAVGPPHSGMLE